MHGKTALLALLLASALAAAPAAAADAKAAPAPALSAQAVPAQAAAGQGAQAGLLDQGLEAFGEERYREALDAFGRILSDPKAGSLRPEAAYWSVLAYLAAGDRAAAEKALDAFVKDYPQSPRVPDLLYQRGRLLYSRGDFEASLKAFSAFVEILNLVSRKRRAKGAPADATKH